MVPDAGPYKVLYNNVRQNLEHFRDRALKSGKSKELLQALIRLNESLQDASMSFGDPLRKEGEVFVLHRLLPPLNITYSVHPSLKLVYLRDVDYIPKTHFEFLILSTANGLRFGVHCVTSTVNHAVSLPVAVSKRRTRDLFSAARSP
jgi:hypothetical protein